MRGENRPIKPLCTAATLVDSDGEPKYYIIPGKLVVVGLISMITLFVLALMLALIIVKNKYEIEALRQQVTIDDQQKNGTER